MALNDTSRSPESDIDRKRSGGSASTWRELKNKLAKRGIPEEEIAVISDYNIDVRRAEVFAKVNSGEVRVIIGSTGKLGTGVNIQERLAVAHFLFQ